MNQLDKVTEQLKKKLGPLPVWQWGIIGAAGIWIWRGLAGRIGAPTEQRAATSEGGVSVGAGTALPASQSPQSEPAFSAPASPLSLGFGEFFASGEGGDILSLLGKLPSAIFDPPTAGGGTFPQPVYTPQPSTPVPVQPSPVSPSPAAPNYLPLSATNIQLLFSRYPHCFKGQAQYWINSLLGQGIPGQTAAQPGEWSDFWAAYSCAGLQR